MIRVKAYNSIEEGGYIINNGIVALHNILSSSYLCCTEGRGEHIPTKVYARLNSPLRFHNLVVRRQGIQESPDSGNTFLNYSFGSYVLQVKEFLCAKGYYLINQEVRYCSAWQF